MPLQPLLHDLLVATMAPTQAWSGADGQVRAAGAQGFYDGDVRVLSRAVLTVDGAEPEAIGAGPAGPGVVEAVSLLRTVDGPGADPTVRLRRRRTVVPGGVEERLAVANATDGVVVVPLEVALAADLAPMEPVKAGHAGAPQAATAQGDVLTWHGDGVDVVVRADAADVDLTDPTAPVLRWRLELRPGETATVEWTLTADRAESPVLPGPPTATWSTPHVRADDRRLTALLHRGLEDLATLRMRARFAPDDVFVAAGAPWFFTLFGRDSLWAARMLLPLGTELAAGTLRTLAARQGTTVDPGTAEQPGKILHEVRSTELDLGDGAVLPPLYYGTVDATPLWVCLLHDAWRWGMPTDEVEALLPAAEAALGWMAEHGDADGDGFLEYLDETGRGLANQGWKDSGDSVQWRDGTLATGPIALCEVQGYAHEAAVAGAALLEAFGRPGAERWRAWAEGLRERFRDAFWVQDDDGGYPAIALDADKKAVDTLTSNIGHLLGTGLLSAADEAQVARRLASPEMDSGYGLRTMATSSDGYWPLRYHGGSVWTHDTAIVVAGLVRAGHPDVAASLAEGLLAAAADVDYRLPELYSGDARGSVPAMVPYPAACRPQAWAAASSVVLLTAFLGLDPDVPAGRLAVRPTAPAPFGALEVHGLRLGGADLSVAVGGDGALTHVRTSAPVRLDVP
ncbi:hypothetical protein N866_13215 [Actinotalea ferrariae CF5-4]|uniref:Uncharacterized protein n=1 Tax=Actinotalea ferrariae CF5-4 TaxID=948458 RepID=A0A021VVA3_9CELL|nr:glycogen debranching N-terminal domain-containing protein [Actinotalea ferrariae]EYR65129.1 hypothetical protein N866_13215 [Actinotalea ferrariae CF5-4]